MSATTTASKPQEQKKSLGDFYNGFVTETVEHFPHLKGQLLVVDMNELKAYGYKDVDEKITGLTPETALTFLDKLPDVIAMKTNKDKSSCALFRNGMHIILINHRIDQAEFSGIAPETEKLLTYILDHELGHLVVPDGRSVDDSMHAHVVADSIADAYAHIRHYQRFGVDSRYRDGIIDPAARTRNMVMDVGTGKNHFTAFVLDEIIKRKHTINFKALDPKQTADLAWRFAMKYLPPTPVIKALYKAFDPVKEAFNSSPEAGLKALIDKTLNPANGYYTFKCGSDWLGRYLDERKFLNGQPINLPREYLDEVAKKLKEREFKLAEEDILFNFPAAAFARPERTPRMPQPGRV